MRGVLQWRVVVLCALLLAAASDIRAQGTPIPLLERARGAERVVVARAASSAPVWRVNEHGDRLIVSIVRVAIEESLKGPAAAILDVEVTVCGDSKTPPDQRLAITATLSEKSSKTICE